LATGVVAFFAKIAGFVGSSTEDTIIPFNVVVLNIGNAYNSNTGRFDAPVAGIYTFSYVSQADGDCETDNVAMKLYVNGSLASIAASKLASSAGASVTTRLDEGNSVFVATYAEAGCQTLRDDMSSYNTFSGHLVYQII
jgi:hypothetical protein